MGETGCEDQNSLKKDLCLLSITAFLAGLPGIFWGVDLLYKGPFIIFHVDEFTFTIESLAFINHGIISRPDYFYGFLGELLPFLCAIKWLGGELSRIQVLIVGRVVSLCFSVGSVWLTYYFTTLLTKQRDAARAAGIVLSFAPLHAVISHHCTPLASSIFWTYACFVSSYLFYRTQNFIFFLISCFASGAAIAVKFGFVTLIPIFYTFFSCSGKKRLWAIIGFLVIVLSFMTLNCGVWPWQYTKLFDVSVYQNFSWREHHRLFNPVVYFVGLMPGFGFFPLVFAATGCLQLVKDGFYDFFKNPSVKARFFFFEIPLLFQFLIICLMTANFIRHILFIFPYLGFLAGVGAVRVYQMTKNKFSKKAAICLMGLIVFYQLISVGWMESKYLFDPFFAARNWVLTHLKSSEKIWMGSRRTLGFASDNFLPNQYLTENLENADYFLLLETVQLVFTRSFLNPLTDEPGPLQWSYWKPSNDPELMRKIVNNKTNFRQEIHFHFYEIIPEFYFYRKWLGIFSTALPNPGNVTIYKKQIHDASIR